MAVGQGSCIPVASLDRRPCLVSGSAHPLVPERPSRDGQAAVKGDAPSRAAGKLFPPRGRAPLCIAK
jgi:hypothetical protein